MIITNTTVNDYPPQRTFDALFIKAGTWKGNKIHFFPRKALRGHYPICGAGHSHTKGGNKSYRMVADKVPVTCKHCLEKEAQDRLDFWLEFMEADH